MNCKKCKAPLPDGARFCPACGKEISPQKKKTKAANGRGSVYRKQTNGSWYAALTTGHNPDGTRKRIVKGGFPTKAAANAWIDEIRNAPPKKDKRLRALFDALEPRLSKLSYDKRLHYKKAWERLTPIHEEMIGDLTVAALQKVVDEAVSTYYPAKDMRDLLSLIYQQAIVEEYVNVNRAAYIILPDLEEKGTVPFTADEVRALWRDYQAGHRETGFILLMIYTGMMPGEMLRLTVDMIQLSEKRIVGAGLKTSERKAKPILLPDVIVPVIVDLMQGRTDRLYDWKDDKLFYKEFAEIKKRAGCRQIKELRPYSCRHTTATTLADANVSAAIIQDVMRHAKITTTQRYIHLDRQASADAIDATFTAPENSGKTA